MARHISTHQLHSSHSQFTIPTTDLIKKLWNLPKFSGVKGSQALRKMEWCDLDWPHALQTPHFYRWSLTMCIWQICNNLPRDLGKRHGQTSFSGTWLLEHFVATNRCARHTPFPTRIITMIKLIKKFRIKVKLDPHENGLLRI